MKASKSIKSSAGAGIFAAMVASLCCITPVLAFTSGISGIASTFSWIEPFRPYLIGFTVLVLGFAWYQKLKPQTQDEADCACEDDQQPSFWQSRRFLGIITVFAGLMLAFPTYSHVFYPEINKGTNSTDELLLATFEIEGMTCSGCEDHIVHAASAVTGVTSAEASYKEMSAKVVYSSSVVTIDEIKSAINETGYKVISMSESEYVPGISSDVSFYSVPLVCNAAPALGCGSRSKPILDSFSSNKTVSKAWLSRSGKFIAIEWVDDSQPQERIELVESVSKDHSVKINLVSGEMYLELSSSFSPKVGWYLGDEVFELSKEEAGIIAGRIISMMKQIDGNSLDFATEAKFRGEIQDIFFTWFVDVNSLEELSDINEYETRLQKVVSLAGKYDGLKAMPDMDSLLSACSGECEHPECSGTSCKLIDSEYVQTYSPLNKIDGFISANFKIEGMTCSGCEKPLESKLSILNGISTVEASYENGNAIIYYDSSAVKIDTIIKTIEYFGYKVKEK